MKRPEQVPLRGVSTEISFKINTLELDRDGALQAVQLPPNVDIVSAVALARIVIRIAKHGFQLDRVETGNGKYASASCTQSNMRFLFLIHLAKLSANTADFVLGISACRLTAPQKRRWFFADTRASDPSSEELILWEQIQQSLEKALLELHASQISRSQGRQRNTSDRRQIKTMSLLGEPDP